MYQHDMKKKHLDTLLEEVVSECVSFVGVDLNTASQCLLRCDPVMTLNFLKLKYRHSFRKIAGLTDKRATQIIDYRVKNGPFINRKELLKVKGIGARAFEQCAGFLRVGPVNEDETAQFYTKPETTKLDRTYIHPESYGVTEKLLRIMDLKVADVGSQRFIERVKDVTSKINTDQVCSQLDIPEATLNLILETLTKPLSHDLRTTHTHTPLFRKGLVDINELNTGMVLSGRVANVTSFGCFIDIGVGCNGLIHSSKMNMLQLQIGDRVEAKVLRVEIERKRIALEAIRKL